MKPWETTFTDREVVKDSILYLPLSSPDIILSPDRLTAYREYNTGQPWALAFSTQSGMHKCYAEVTATAFTGNLDIGIANKFMVTNLRPGGDPAGNSVAFDAATNISIGAVVLANTPFNFGPGDTLALAFDANAKTIQFRSISQNSAWSPPVSFAAIGLPPYYLVLGFETQVGDNARANFFGPFQGPVPAGYANWNPEALFSEQPVKVLDFEAMIPDGQYSSDDVNDLAPIPFSYIRWGDANLDAVSNLRVTDWVTEDDGDVTASWVTDDWPILSLTISAEAAPGNNYIWGSWDGQPSFLISRFHFNDTGPQYLTNIPIPPPQVPAPNQGEGHTLALAISCDTTALFSWINGRVFGTENVLVWAPIESATAPPSKLGIVQPVIAGTNPATFPGFTPLLPPPLIGAGGGLIGPAIKAAAVPPSVAGIVQPVYGTGGSATVPTGAALLPRFSTTFPVPTFVVSNIWAIPTFAGGVWTSTLPPRTVTTPPIALGGWGLPGPSGSGPGPPTYPNPPGAGSPHLAANENAEPEVATESAPEQSEDEPPHARRHRRQRRA